MLYVIVPYIVFHNISERYSMLFSPMLAYLTYATLWEEIKSYITAKKDLHKKEINGMMCGQRINQWDKTCRSFPEKKKHGLRLCRKKLSLKN